MSLISPSSSLNAPASELQSLSMAALKVKLETSREINLDTTFSDLENAWGKKDGYGPIKRVYDLLQILYSTIHDSNNVYDSELLRIGALDATKRNSEKQKLDDKRKIQILEYKQGFSGLQTHRETVLKNVSTIDFVVNKLISLHENKIYDIDHSLTMKSSEKEKLKEYQNHLDKLKRYSTELTLTTQQMKELVKKIANHTLLKSEHQLLPAYWYNGGGLALRTYRHVTEQGGNLLGGTANILGATSEILSSISGFFMSFKAAPPTYIDGKTSKPTTKSFSRPSSSCSSGAPLASSSCSSSNFDSLKPALQTPIPLHSKDNSTPASLNDLHPLISNREEPTNLSTRTPIITKTARGKVPIPTETFVKEKADGSFSESSNPKTLTPLTAGSQEPSPTSTPQNKEQSKTEKTDAHKTVITQGEETSTYNLLTDTSEKILSDDSFSGSDFLADSENQKLMQDLIDAPKDIAPPLSTATMTDSSDSLPGIPSEEAHSMQSLSKELSTSSSKSTIEKVNEGKKAAQKERSEASKKRRNKRKKAKKKSSNI